MKSFLKIFTVVFLLMGLGIAALSGLMFIAVRNAGFASIAVHDGHEGLTVTAPIPLLPVHIATSVMNGLPVRVEWDHHELPEVRHAMAAMIAEIESGPDATLVEIDEHGDRITLSKRGDQLELNVDDGWDRVRISVPIRTASRVAHSLR